MDTAVLKKLPIPKPGKTSPETYGFLFGVMKTLENSPHNHDFSVHGKTEVVNFRINRNRSQMGMLSFRPAQPFPALENPETVSDEFIAGFGKQIDDKRVELSDGSEKAFSIILACLKGRMIVTRTACEVVQMWSGRGVKVKLNGILIDDQSAPVGFIDFDFTLAPRVRGWRAL